MKNKKALAKRIIQLTLALFGAICILTPLPANLWYMTVEAGDYTIPKESSIFSFEATRMNEGSGGWWTYGEDGKYYYTSEIADSDTQNYAKRAKDSVPRTFDRWDASTWITKPAVPAYVKDSISPYGERVRMYGNDSIYHYNKDSSLSLIQYLDTLSPIVYQNYDKQGALKYIEYNPQYSKDGLLDEYFYPGTNNVSFREWVRDTIIYTAGDPVQCRVWMVNYHENGKIKEEGYHGFFLGTRHPSRFVERV